MITQKEQNKIKYWIATLIIIILFMIFLGGITRLTHSGLSITEWNPITGILPPLNKQQWLQEFAKYQATPEFKLINFDISFENFKSIYLMEYSHRVLGRFIGLFFFIPFIFFFYRFQLPSNIKKTLLLIGFLIIAQGFMGWYMVKSGLVNNPDVSHFRLAAHLGLALFILTLSVYIFTITSKNNIILDNYSIKFKNYLLIISSLIFIQIIIGALVAGLDAGLVYNDFPLMNNKLLPDNFTNNFLTFNLYDPGIIQFFHRIMAYILFLIAALVVIKTYLTNNIYLRKNCFRLFYLILLQILIGIITLLYNVPIYLGSIHQMVAVIIYLKSIFILFTLYQSKVVKT